MLKVAYCQYELKAFRNARTMLEGVEHIPGHRVGTIGRAATHARGRAIEPGSGIVEQRTRHDSRIPGGAALKITETFVSIQGEADAVGWPTLFIRLTGCPLRCVYCDTQYAFYGGEWTSLEALVDRSCEHCRAIVTGIGGLKGAEAVWVSQLNQGLVRFRDPRDDVRVDARVSRVVDLKSPSRANPSGTVRELPLLGERDQPAGGVRAQIMWGARCAQRWRRAARCCSSELGSARSARARVAAGRRLDVRLRSSFTSFFWGNERR